MSGPIDVYLSITTRPEELGLPTVAAGPPFPAVSPLEAAPWEAEPPAEPNAAQQQVIESAAAALSRETTPEQDAVLAQVAPPESRAPRRSLLAAAAQDVLDMLQGTGQILGSLAAQTVPYLPGLPAELRPTAEAMAAERWEELGRLASEAPQRMFEGLTASYTRPLEAFREHPVYTVSDWALPFSVASFGLRQAGRVAGVLGHGAFAASLAEASEAVRPLAVLGQAARAVARIVPAPAGVEVPPLLGWMAERRLAREAGRELRRTAMVSERQLRDVLTRLEAAWQRIPDADRPRLVRAIEGTLDEADLARLSEPAKEFARLYHEFQVGSWEPHVALVLGQGNPALVANYLEIFSLARYKPLAAKLTAEARARADELARRATLGRRLLGLGIFRPGDPRRRALEAYIEAMERRAEDLAKGVPLEEARALVEAGRLPHLEMFPPTYYPHRFPRHRAPHASLRETLESELPGPLRRRKGEPGFERDAMKALAQHYTELGRDLARYQAISQVVRRQGVELGSFLSREEIALELDRLYRQTGYHWVWFVPEVPHRVLQIRQRLQAVLEGEVRALGGTQTFAGMLTDGLRQALEREVDDAVRALGPAPDSPPALGAPRPPAFRIYAIPEATARRLLAELRPESPIVQAIGRATDVWRAFVLALSPRWHVQNAYGNLLLALLSGHYRPDQIAKIRDVILPDIQTASLAAEVQAVRALRQEALAERRLGPFHWGEWAAALERRLPLGHAQNLISALYDLNAVTDRFFRSAVFAGKVRQQAIRELRAEGHAGLRLDPDLVVQRMREIAGDPVRARAAIDWVQRWMGNYFDLTPVERRYLRTLVFPFWTWYRSMAKLVATLPVDTPGRTIALSALAQVMVEAERDRDPLIPAELRGRVPVAVRPDGYLITIDAQSLVPWYTLVQGIPSLSPGGALALAALSGSTFFGRLQTEPGLETAGGRYYWSDQWPPDEVTWFERRALATIQTARDVLRIPLVRLAETAVTGTAPVSGQPLFTPRVTAFPAMGRQTPTEALLSQLSGFTVREVQEGLARRWATQRLRAAYRKGVRTRAMERAGSAPVTIRDLEEWLREGVR